MKKTIFLFFALFAAFLIACDSGSSEGESEEDSSEEVTITQDDAIAFNDELVALEEEAYMALTDLENAIYDADLELIEANSIAFDERIAAGMEFLEADEHFDSSFKDAGVEMFDAYKTSAEEYIPTMIAYWTMPAEEADDLMSDAEQEAYDAMYALIEDASQEFISSQEEFAKEWNFILE